MGYSQALEEQVSLLERVRKSEWMVRDEWRDAATATTQMLTDAESYFWARSLCEPIRAAANALPKNWRWQRPEVLPTPAGFIWFEQPLAWSDPSFDGALVIAALGWMRFQDEDSGGSRLMVCPFGPDDHGDHTGRPRPYIVLTLGAEESIEDGVQHVIANAGRNSPRMAALSGCAYLTLGACLEFLQQRIVVAPQHRIERHARRRLERQKYEHAPVVRVVELRRKHVRSEQRGESDPVEWSHQWIVSGHWRQQWYPSLNMHQPRWVMPYVKGPEDAPLKPPRAKVFAVVR